MSNSLNAKDDKQTKMAVILQEIAISFHNNFIKKVPEQLPTRSLFFLSGTALLTGVINHLQGGYADVETVKTAAGVSAFISFLGPQLSHASINLTKNGLKLFHSLMMEKLDGLTRNDPEVNLSKNNFIRISNQISALIAEEDVEGKNYWLIKSDQGKLLKVLSDENYKNHFLPMVNKSNLRLLETSFQDAEIVIKETVGGVLDSSNGPAEVVFYNNNGNYEVLYERFWINGQLCETEEEFKDLTQNKITDEPTLK